MPGIVIPTDAAQPSERLRRLPGELSRQRASATSPTPSTCPGRIDEALVDFLSGADIMIYDCMYTDAEFDHFRGYGHSTWEEGVRLCEAAGVRRLVIFHHRPGRDDDGPAADRGGGAGALPGRDRRRAPALNSCLEDMI